MEILCNIKNVFTVTFNVFNASLINDSINYLKKINYACYNNILLHHI